MHRLFHRFSALQALRIAAVLTVQFTAFSQQSRVIDSLKTDDEVDEFIQKTESDYNDFRLNRDLENFGLFDKDNGHESAKIAQQLKLKPWQKADFDGNGKTDLLVVGTISAQHSVLCILDLDSSYRFINLTQGEFRMATFPIVRTRNDETFIDYYEWKHHVRQNAKLGKDLKKTVLHYAFGGIIEYKVHSTDLPIQEVIYSAEWKYRTNMELTINSAGVATLRIYDKDTNTSTQQVKSRYKLLVYTHSNDSLLQTFDQLSGLLNSIRFEELANSYVVKWTDDQTVQLNIGYGDSQQKYIGDYGAIGTFGLATVYEVMETIADQLDQYVPKNPPPIRKF